MCDPNGTWPSWNTFFKTIAVVAAAVAVVATAVAFAPIIAGVGAVAGTGALVVAGVAAAVSASAVIAAGIQSKVNNMSTLKSYSDQSVYIMRDSKSKEVAYIGRTNDPARRQKEHDKDVKKQHLEPLEVKITGLTVKQARLTEQILISAYAIDKLDNARREISIGKVNKYVDCLYDIINIFGGYAESEYLSLLGR